MKVGVLGTGMVGTTIGSKLTELGHEVKLGSRTVNNPKVAEWLKATGKKASQGTFTAAAVFGEIIFNCTHGVASLDALKQAGAANLKGKILIDVANPLDFLKGAPAALTICNLDSLGEQIQKAFPEAKVVKTLNTMNCKLMVNPSSLKGNHTVFVSGNDENAKAKVKTLLNEFGWKDSSIIDTGDITSARGSEMLLPMWLRLMGALSTPHFNFSIVK